MAHPNRAHSAVCEWLNSSVAQIASIRAPRETYLGVDRWLGPLDVGLPWTAEGSTDVHLRLAGIELWHSSSTTTTSTYRKIGIGQIVLQVVLIVGKKEGGKINKLTLKQFPFCNV